MSLDSFYGRYPLNAPGKFYVFDNCIDCGACWEIAPDIFKRDDERAHTYVIRQPATPEEVAGCERAVAECPVEAVASDGVQFDWRTTPIRAWASYSPDLRPYLAGLPIISEEERHPGVLRRIWGRLFRRNRVA